MKKRKVLKTLIASVILGSVVFLLASCSSTKETDNTSNQTSETDNASNQTSETETQDNKYTVTWANYDGTILETDTDLEEGIIPTYDGAIPSKVLTAQYSYNFKGWDKEIVSVTGDITYTATFEEVINKYTVTFKNYDGTVLETKEIEYGKTPEYSGTTPSKEGNEEYSYNFIGWDKEIVSVTGNVTYTADFDEVVNKYTVTFKNYDGSVLETKEVEYGKTPEYSGTTPSKEGNEEYSYNFIGWDKEIVSVTGNVTYTADFDEVVNKYTVTFKNYDGSVLETKEIEYGKTPAYSGTTPIKESTIQYTYTFKGWDKEITSVTGDTTYTATFEEVVNEYTVTFKNYDGTIISTKTYLYGKEIIVPSTNPERTSDETYTYTFKGWDKEVTTCDGDKEYIATYIATYIDYTITFKNYDGTIISTKTYHYGDTIITPNETPTKASDELYYYEFAGWNIDIDIEKYKMYVVWGDATFTATYTQNLCLVYELNSTEDGYIITGFNYAVGKMTIPSTYNNLPVVEIADEAFKHSGITGITIPDSVTSIGKMAFFSCLKLESITIPNSVTSIGTSAFHTCTSLTSIVIPDSVTSIGRRTFYDCESLKSIVIPEGVTSIGDYVFYYCHSLTNITIPNSVTSIGEWAFFECTSLSSIKIGNSVTNIGIYAFAGCTSLTNIIIPSSVTEIGGRAFDDCTSLESITLPFVGSSASATEPSSYTLFGCIFGSSHFEGVEITQRYSDNSSSTITHLPTTLKSVTITGGNILFGAFSGCTSLESITIGDNVTSIGDSAFSGCSSLTNITMPDSVTSIEDAAFYNCTSLESITIPNSVTSISAYTFKGCKSLTSITILEGVTSIGEHAFENCINLESITIPNSVTSIADSAFYNCTSLKSIIIPNSVTSIADSAFYNCTSLESIIIPNSVTSIGSSAFYNCTSLESITIPNSVTIIEVSAFYNCTSLTNIIIPNSVTSIGAYAFQGCKSLTSITILEGVTSIGEYAFSDCSSLESITIGNNVASIGWYAFNNCISLTTITYEGTVSKWKNIILSYNWNYSVPATKVICSNGEIEL